MVSLSFAGFACAGGTARVARALPICRKRSGSVLQKEISGAASYRILAMGVPGRPIRAVRGTPQTSIHPFLWITAQPCR